MHPDSGPFKSNEPRKVVDRAVDHGFGLHALQKPSPKALLTRHGSEPRAYLWRYIWREVSRGGEVLEQPFHNLNPVLAC